MRRGERPRRAAAVLAAAAALAAAGCGTRTGGPERPADVALDVATFVRSIGAQTAAAGRAVADGTLPRGRLPARAAELSGDAAAADDEVRKRVAPALPAKRPLQDAVDAVRAATAALTGALGPDRAVALRRLGAALAAAGRSLAQVAGALAPGPPGRADALQQLQAPLSGAPVGAAQVAAAPPGRDAPPDAASRLLRPHACARVPGATCATLRVALDPAGRTPGTLRLAVALAGPARGPALVVLAGGPGQPGVPFLGRVRMRLAPLAPRWRLVMLDQRGTGAGALRCPALQRRMGTSDLAVPRPAEVRACAAAIGARRRLFTTTEVVADLEALRVALGTPRLAFDGTSYGTYVAERYALAHPQRVDRLVLDSVVPHTGVDALSDTSERASARVLRAVCGPACPSDPARDLAAVVRRRRDGPAILDMLTAFSIGAPHLAGAPAALRAARAGRSRTLDGLLSLARLVQRAPAVVLSQGLHAATLCGDLRAPWGGADAPLAGRAAALAGAARGARVWPFDAATASGNGIARTCLPWPPEPVAPPALARDLPPVPVLLLAGDRDLATPLEWARAEAARSPRGRLVVVVGAGHSVQSQARPAARRALAAFLR